ncbi:hypothetical protein E2C01_041191 [Portunus trituberculatus]|uniref:Uncharacterized protein n=1 Tax=Portunus trituberculatus TaxID=210409 RepID=A0A5B7FSV5_PORTR|nr:hypothetical protein [Portunus trituberculatus]
MTLTNTTNPHTTALRLLLLTLSARKATLAYKDAERGLPVLAYLACVFMWLVYDTFEINPLESLRQVLCQVPVLCQKPKMRE